MATTSRGRAGRGVGQTEARHQRANQAHGVGDLRPPYKGSALPKWVLLQWAQAANFAPNGSRQLTLAALRAQCPCCAWIAACPRPRAMSQRLTGYATTPAMRRLTVRLHQNSASPRPAASAPGTSTMNRLSTISIVAIEAVSDASASGTTWRSGSRARSNVMLVRP